MHVECMGFAMEQLHSTPARAATPFWKKAGDVSAGLRSLIQ
jgi:hypothetical protein